MEISFNQVTLPLATPPPIAVSHASSLSHGKWKNDSEILCRDLITGAEFMFSGGGC